MPSFPDPLPLLGDGVAALRLAAERDIPEVLIAHQDDPDLARALREPRPPSGAQLGQRVERSAMARHAGTEAWLTITDADGDVCLGQLEVVGVDWDHQRAELLLWIAPGDRRRGLGAAALGLAGRWLLRDVGLQRVQLLGNPADPALRGVAARAGYRSEGVLRGHWLDAGGRADAEVWALVAADL